MTALASVADDVRETAAPRRTTALLVAVPLVCAVIAVVARVHRLDLPFERDEGECAYIAQRMLRGDAPYTEAYTMKLPGVPLWYALAFSLFGETVRAAHLMALFVDVISAAALAWWCRGVVKDSNRLAQLAVWASCSFLVLSTLSSFQGLVANCEKFVLPGIIAGFALLASSKRWWHVVLAAVFVGGAFVCKQQILPVVAVFGLAALAREHDGGWRQRVRDSVLVAVGIAAPWIATVAMVKAWGSFDAFWFQTVTYARAYVGAALHPMQHLEAAFWRTVKEPLVVVGLVGVVVAVVGVVLSRWARAVVALWWLASIAALSIGLYFRPHYFVFAIPLLAIGVAVFATQRWWTTLIVVVAMLASIGLDRKAWFTHSNNAVSNLYYRQNTFVDATTVARELRRLSREDERILILGNEPEVLFYANRRSVTPYIYFYPLLEHQPFAQQQQQEVIDDVAAQAPDHIVVQVKSLRFLEGARGPIRGWGLKLVKDYDIVWPPHSPPTLDAKVLKATRASLILLRRKGLPPPSNRMSKPGTVDAAELRSTPRP
jgi:hypothetical protein